MNTNRNIAITTGVLFALSAITFIPVQILHNSILTDPGFSIRRIASEARTLWEMFFEIVLIFIKIGIGVTFFPILRKFNETMALGTICFRLLEAVMALAGIICLLTIITINHGLLHEMNPDTPIYLMAEKLLLTIRQWTYLYGFSLMAGSGSFLTGYILYHSKLVPRFIAMLGLVGGSLITINAMLITFGFISRGSLWEIVISFPAFAFEASLAIQLLSKGFKVAPTIGFPVQNLFQLARGNNRDSLKF